MTTAEHLSQIQTLWSVVRRAHGDRLSQHQQAQERLLARYGGAARRYLLAALRDEDEADDAYQDFMLRFVRGDFHAADPAKGRFRSFLKTVLYRMIVDRQRARSDWRAAHHPRHWVGFKAARRWSRWHVGRNRRRRGSVSQTTLLRLQTGAGLG